MSFLPCLGSSSELIPYSSSVSAHLGSLSESDEEESVLTRGRLSRSGGVALLYSGPCLEVLNVTSNERLSSVSFPSAISALESLGSDQVVIGLESGVVSLLDIKISKVIKSISFPARISSLCVIPDSRHSGLRSLAEELMFFQGVLAVGTQSGDLYLLDLSLDKSQVDVSRPVGTSFITAGRTRGLADLRHSTQEHLIIQLNDSHDEARGGLVISALEPIPQLGSIAVGYNSGAWKLWNLNRLNSDFSFYPSPSDAPLLPVVGFAFQEPENDPRNHCYLWVLRSFNDIDSEEEKSALQTFSTVDLYALRYENKDEVDQYGVLYSGLTSCSKSFAFKLTGDPEDHRREKSSMGLTVRTLGMLSPGRQAQLDISGTECDSIYTQGLCVFMWEVRSYDDTHSKTYLGVFDLNMWYQDQMPLECMDDEICPFLSYCSMEDVLTTCPGANILDVLVDLASISRCKSSISSEKNSYPSSLSFEMIAILDKGFVQTSHLGLQKKVLLELQTDGHTSLVEPYNLYKLCRIAGFISEINLTGKSEQRSALLTVALEHNLVNLLTGCVSHWNDGKYSNEGCTMKALLDWAWQRIIFIKQMIDKVTAPLFDLSSLHFNESFQVSLIQNSQQLHNLCAVIQELISQSVVASQIGYEELQIKMNVVRLVNLYVKVVLWFFSAGLLPELPEPEIGAVPLLGRDSPYPYSELSVAYQTKRRQMKILHSKWGYSDVPLLLIDGLCSQFDSKLSSNFERDGGDGLYPPPTLFSILSAYLIDDHRSSLINDVGKHRLIHYLFLDIADKRCNDEIWSDMIDRLIQFPSAFSVPPSIIKLTQAFWLLDQGDFEEAMGMLLDPLILDKDINSWEHRAIIVAFLVQDQPKAALKYSRIRKPPVRDAFDIQLHVSVLLSTGNIHEAFQFQRNRRNTCKDLLKYFFIQAEKLGKLNLLFELTLTTFEETEFVNFLQNSESCSEVLLMYYLQRYRFQEALSYHGLLKQKNLSTPTHEALMSRYSNLLPNLLVKSKNYETLKVAAPSKLPVPLSREVKMTNFNPMFHKSIIENQIETSLDFNSPSKVFTPFRPRGQRINPVEKRRFVEVSKPKREEDDDIIVQTPPSKRSRFIETRTLEDEKVSPVKALPAIFTEEISSILCTPTIKRKDPQFLRSAFRGKEMDSPFTTPSSTKLTPSILKNTMEAANTPPTQKSSLSSTHDESSLSKSLRFNTPKKLPPLELKPVNPMELMSSEDENVEVISIESSPRSRGSPSTKNLKPDSPSSRSSVQKSPLPSKILFSSVATAVAPTETPPSSLPQTQHGHIAQNLPSHLATPRKPISAYLDDESPFLAAMNTPKLSVSISERIQSQKFAKKHIQSFDTDSSEGDEGECLVMSEGNDSIHEPKESRKEEVEPSEEGSEKEKDNQSEDESSSDKESNVEVMIKDTAATDADKFISRESQKTLFKHISSPFAFKSTNATKDTPPTNFDKIIKNRAAIDFNQFLSSHGSSSSVSKIVKTSTTSCSSSISSRTLFSSGDRQFSSSKTMASLSTSGDDLSDAIKQQVSSDFKFARKSIHTKDIPTTAIYMGSEEKTGEDEEVTPEKIKQKALKSAEEWAKKSPYLQSVSKRVSHREPIHSTTKEEEEDSSDMGTLIKGAAMKDFKSFQSESRSMTKLSPPKPKETSTPFRFSMDTDGADSDVLDDDEDEYPVEEEEKEDISEPCPEDQEQKETEEPHDLKFDFAQPVALNDEVEEEVLFSFSKGESIDPSLLGSENEATNELENVRFSFTEELTAVEDETTGNKMEFSFSEPRNNLETAPAEPKNMSPLPSSKCTINKKEASPKPTSEVPKDIETSPTRSIRRSKRISQLGGDKNPGSPSMTAPTAKSIREEDVESTDKSCPKSSTQSDLAKATEKSSPKTQSKSPILTSKISESETSSSKSSASKLMEKENSSVVPNKPSPKTPYKSPIPKTSEHEVSSTANTRSAKKKDASRIIEKSDLAQLPPILSCKSPTLSPNISDPMDTFSTTTVTRSTKKKDVTVATDTSNLGKDSDKPSPNLPSKSSTLSSKASTHQDDTKPVLNKSANEVDGSKDIDKYDVAKDSSHKVSRKTIKSSVPSIDLEKEESKRPSRQHSSDKTDSSYSPAREEKLEDYNLRKRTITTPNKTMESSQSKATSKSAVSQKTPRRYLRSSEIVAKDVLLHQELSTPQKEKANPSSIGSEASFLEKKTRVGTPRRFRSSLSEEKELPKPRRSKRISHSSVVPVLSSDSKKSDTKKDLESSSHTFSSSSSLVSHNEDHKEPPSSDEEKSIEEPTTSKLNVIREEEGEDYVPMEDVPLPPVKRSRRSKKSVSREGIVPLEKVLEEEQEAQASTAAAATATPLRKSKRISAKSQAYEEELVVSKPKQSTSIKSKEKSTEEELSDDESVSSERMYAHDEPFNTSSFLDKEDNKSDEKKSTSTTRRKRYSVQKKIVSQKFFF